MVKEPEHHRAAREHEEMLALENRLMVASIADPTAGMTRKQRRRWDADMRRKAKRLPKPQAGYQEIGDNPELCAPHC